MSWTLDIQRGSGGPVIASRSNINPTGVLGGFNWRTAPSGDCIDCDFEGFINQLGLQNRDLIRVKVDGTAVFFGPVVELPHPRDRKRGAVNAVGARDLLSRRVIGTETYVNTDVASIAALLVARYNHPALGYDPANFPATGKVLSEFTMPWRTLEQALETLSKSASPNRPVPYGVRADGQVFFGSFAASTLALSMADLADLQWLRVSGDDVVTSSYLIALNKLSGTGPRTISNYPIGYVQAADFEATRPSGAGVSNYGATYVPATYVMRADDPIWSDLKAEAAHLLPDGADILNAPGTGFPSPFYLEGLIGAVALSDGNPASFAENDPASASHLAQYAVERGTPSDPVIGFRLVYSLNLTGFTGELEGYVTLQYSYPNPVGQTPDGNGGVQLLSGSLFFDYTIPDTKGAMQEIIAICPASEQTMAATLNGELRVNTPTPYSAYLSARVTMKDAAVKLPASAYKIYSFEPIFLDRQKVDTLARTFLRPPAQEPTELTLPGLHPAAFAVTVADAPGGALSAGVSEIEGQLTPEGDVKTVIKLEQPGASVEARMLRLVAQRSALGSAAP